MYSYLIANWLNGGNFIRRNRMTATDIKTDYNVIMTKNRVKKIFRVQGIKPENRNGCFIDFVKDKMFQLNPNVTVAFNIVVNPCSLSVTSDKFIRSMSRSADTYEQYKEVFESQTGVAKLTGKTYRLPNGGSVRLSKDTLDLYRQVYLSYQELYTHINDGGSVGQVNVFIELWGDDISTLNRARKDLYGILNQASIGAVEVRSVNKAYLLEQCPATPAPKTISKKFLPQLLFTSDNLAAFTSYKSRGLVGGRGLLLGLCQRSKLPFAVNMFEAPSAQVMLLLGKTGSGKTYAAFQLAMSVAAFGEYCSAIDIKGREWCQVAKYIPSKIITFDDKNPSFVNILRLDDMNVDSSNCKEIYASAVNGAVTLLSLIVNLTENEGNPKDLEVVLREAVNKLYSINGVYANNPKSFVNSKSLRYSDILPILESLQNTKSYTKDQVKMLLIARSRCHAYLGDSGIFSNAFKNEVTLKDVMESPLVIYEFNKNQGAMTDAIDVIRIFMVQFLDTKKKAMLKQQGKYLFCFYEELQRCDQFANLLEYICADVTGSRSNNAVIILLLNSIRVLSSPRAQDIRSNITSFIVGRIEKTDIESIAETFDQPWLSGQLELMSSKPTEYRNCFCASIDTGKNVYQTVYKVELPEYMQVDFRTRTIIEDEES